MDKSLAKIQFEKYIIKDIQFKLNTDYTKDPNEHEVEMEIAFNHSLSFDPEKSKAELTLLCEVSKDFEQHNRPFFVSVELVGMFSYEIDSDYEIQKRLLLMNGSAILFPYVRATISMITMLSGVPSFMLPTVNIAKLLQDSQEKL